MTNSTGNNLTDATTGCGMLLIISGPSGVGKSTIAHRVEKQLAAAFSVSMTTRTKTQADTEGVDYFFVSKEKFQMVRDGGGLLEWAEVFGHYYGTPRNAVEQHLATGRLVILEIDVQGAIQVKANMPDSYALFVLPPSEEELLRRLRDRRREDEATIQRRFTKAKAEINQARYSGVYDSFLVNDCLSQAVTEAAELVRAQWASRRGSSV